MNRVTRKEIKEGLKQIPLDSVLGVSKRLTHKQKEFAKGIAMGKTASGAYRDAYDTKGKPNTVHESARRLKENPAVSREIQAYQVAIEAAKYRTPAHLRELVIHSLVQTVIDPDIKESTRLQAVRILGTVSEVSAFTERKEITTVKRSEDARDTIMQELKRMLKNNATDVDYADADTLLSELAGTGATPTTPIEGSESQTDIHTIPHIGSPEEDLPPSDSEIDPPPPTKNLDEESK